MTPILAGLLAMALYSSDMSAQQGQTSFKTQQVNVAQPKAAGADAAAGPGGAPGAAPAAAAGAPQSPGGTPIRYQGLIRQQPNKATTAQNPLATNMTNSLMNLLGGNRGDNLPADWDDNTVFNENHKFAYGGKGLKNIGSGLCTSKNSTREQVTRGYCGILADVLTKPGTCANAYMQEIMAEADRGNLGQLDEFCPGYQNLKTNKWTFFQQLLASLITLESGWNPEATEPEWRTEHGERRQGKGLFQIGDWESNYPGAMGDCAQINSTTIYKPEINIKCGACIAMYNLATKRENGRMTVGHGASKGAVGLAGYFGPLRDGQASKRASMAHAVSSYCLGATGGSDAAVSSGGVSNMSSGSSNTSR